MPRQALGTNPLDVEEETLRKMVSGSAPATTITTTPDTVPPPDDPPIHRTGVYLSLEETEALRVRSFTERRTKTDIIRAAIRDYLDLA